MNSQHGHDHSHAVVTEGNARKLTFALILTSSFLVIEVIAGFMTQSLALLSDAAHMFTDAAALAIALAAIKIGKLPADDRRTFGYQRFEILAALFNASMLFAVAMYILYEAYLRFSQPPEIQSAGMMIVAVIGLIINLISMRILFSSAQDSLNVKGAYLEVLSDALGSVGVIIGAAVIYFTGWMWVDTLIAVLIGFWVLPRTWILLKQSINILLEGVPEEIDIEKLRNGQNKRTAAPRSAAQTVSNARGWTADDIAALVKDGMYVNDGTNTSISFPPSICLSFRFIEIPNDSIKSANSCSFFDVPEFLGKQIEQ